MKQYDLVSAFILLFFFQSAVLLFQLTHCISKAASSQLHLRRHWARYEVHFIQSTRFSLGFPCSSAGKESACNAGNLGSVPELGRSSGEVNGYPLQDSGLENSMDNMGFPRSSVGKESACNAGDLDLIPGLGRCPGEGNGNPLQYSCLENPMDRGTWQATVHGVTRGSQFSLLPTCYFLALKFCTAVSSSLTGFI